VTTRTPRGKERPGKDYIFVSDAVFKRKVKSGDFIEWAQNFGYYYGTPRKNVGDALKKGKDVILTIDVKGASQIRRKIPGSVLVFIMPPSAKVLERRLKARATDKAAAVSERLKTAKKEIAQAHKYDYVITNDELDRAINMLQSIIIAKRCEAHKLKPMNI